MTGLLTAVSENQTIEHEPISKTSGDTLVHGDFYDKSSSKPLTIEKPSKLTELETRQVLETVSKADLQTAEITLDTETVKERATKIAKEFRELNAIRFSELMIQRRDDNPNARDTEKDATFYNNETHNSSFYLRVIEQGPKLALVAEHLDKQVGLLNAMCAGAEIIDEALADKGVPEDVRLKVTQQSDAIITKALSDLLGKYELNDDENTDFRWSTDVHANLALNEVLAYTHLDKPQKHIPGMAADKLLGVLKEYQKPQNIVNTINIGPESAALARRVEGVIDNIYLDRVASGFGATLKDMDINLYAVEKEYDTFTFSQSVEIERVVGVVNPESVNSDRYGPVVSRISKKAFADTVLAGVLAPNIVDTSFSGDAEFGRSFQDSVIKTLNNSQVLKMLEVMGRVAYNYENIESVAVAGSQINKEEWLRVAAAAIGKEVAIATSARINAGKTAGSSAGSTFEFAINAPINAIARPDSQEKEMQAEFADALDYFRFQMTEYLKDENKLKDEEFANRLAFSLIDTAVKMRACDKMGITTVGRLIAPSEEYPYITMPDGNIRRIYTEMPVSKSASPKSKVAKK